MKITSDPTNFDPDTRWINPAYPLLALLAIAWLALLVIALTT